MPTSDEIAGELREIFAAEAAEHIDALNRGMLDLEAGSGAAADEVKRALFREAHTLKGAARAVNLEEVEALAHELENLFTELSGDAPDPGLLQRAYRTIDTIAELLQARTGPGARGPEPDERAPDGSAPTAHSLGDTVRIPTRKLDALQAHVGEITISRLGVEQRVADARALEASLSSLESAQRKNFPSQRDRRRIARDEFAQQARQSIARLRTALEGDVRRLGQVLADLEEEVNRARLLPVGSVLGGFPRMVRDLARDTGKQIALVLGGESTEIDRSLLEQIKDPLTHLVRNCVEHAIEAPDERVRAGKPRTGTITISARQQAERLILEVSDDGKGIEVTTVRRMAIERGVLAEDSAEALSDEEVTALIFRPGLSTAASVTELSGRGVGLDAVRDAAERLKGSVSVESTAGAGTSFRLTFPLAVSTVKSILLQCGGLTFALPLAGVERIVRIDDSGIVPAQGRRTLVVEGEPVLLASLAELLGLPPAEGTDPLARRPAIVVSANGRRIALLADRVMTTAEVVGKSLPQPLARVRHVAGAAILGSGQVVVILNESDLIASAARGDRISGDGTAPDIRRQASVLVVEDSITTRTLEKNILEAAGYSVMGAGDGLEAWSILQAHTFDLVVADVEMPKMDGLALTTKIRSDQRLRDLPVVLVTSRDSQEDRERGAEAGADAYIVKGAFDQERLLSTIRKLLP